MSWCSLNASVWFCAPLYAVSTIRVSRDHSDVLFFSSSARGTTEPLPWTEYFAQELYLDASTPDETIVYHAYLTPPSAKGPLFVTHHGAGSSGLSFAILTPELRRLLPSAGVLSIDARDHGETIIHRLHSDQTILDSPRNTDVLDLRLETLSSDMVNAIQLTQVKMGWEELPELVLVGHSLGGAVVTNVARTGDLGNRVLGYAVLDVVEGSFIYEIMFRDGMVNCKIYRFSNRCVAKHAKLSLDSPSWLPIISLRDRMAVSVALIFR